MVRFGVAPNSHTNPAQSYRTQIEAALCGFGRLGAFILSIAFILGAGPAPAATKSINVVSKSPRVGNLTLYQNSWSVLIGINDYKNKDIPDLKFAEKDVADMRRSLRRLDFPSNQILTLTGRKATKGNILRLLGDQLPRKVGRSDRVIVYFSGHGMDEKVGGRERGVLVQRILPSKLFVDSRSETDFNSLSGKSD